MIEALALTVVTSLADFPTYTDTQWIHTDDWSARIKVNYYEDANLFEYDILNSWWSTEDIDLFYMFYGMGEGLVVWDNMELQPGSLTTYELTSFGGYEHGTGYIGSENFGTPFNIIVPVSVPAPSTLALLSVAGICATRRRR
tara:strand:+ start:1006 stop:1431 length:426 start_codon:yes stop_codon:yes gene_type:complete